MPQQTFQQVRDVVKRIRSAHQRLRDALEEPRPRSTDSRTRQMLEAMRRDEQQLQFALAKQLATDDKDSLLETWLQFVPDEELLETLESIDFTPDMPAEEAVARKQAFNQALTLLLRQLADTTAVPRVREFFGSLLQEVESRTEQESWSLREFQGNEVPPRPAD